MKNALLSRKFLLAIAVLFTSAGMAYLEKLTPELMELLKWLTGMYFGFNVTQKATEWFATRSVKNDKPS